MTEESIVSKCMTCRFGIAIKGRVLQRSTFIDHPMGLDDDDDVEEDNPFDIPEWARKDPPKEPEDSVLDENNLKPTIEYSTNYAPMFFNECFFPHTPLQASANKHKPIGLSDCIVDECNRFLPLERLDV